MEEQPGLSSQYRKSSPWPMFVALGLVLSEFGVFMGGPFVPVAVGGVLILEASVAGILRESGYTRSLWPSALGLGALVGAAGGLLLVLTTYHTRALSLVGAGAIALVAGVVLFLVESKRL
ncbi:DUF7541 family protein [Halospeciosus flavus]|uniref:Cox cluster protein n=1 Tax=Halospeciosus flavus TaxID=3032283 RepID=A0ABD5Z4R1_9EURY|nr:cox cluster protein [Halospeciosus flavus]